MLAKSLENISCKFGNVLAVEDISLDVKAGDFVTLLGRSGCGKTTTLRMAAGLVQNSAGAPEAIYQRPSAREVAAFFGTPNLLEARASICRILPACITAMRSERTSPFPGISIADRVVINAPALSGGQR